MSMKASYKEKIKKAEASDYKLQKIIEQLSNNEQGHQQTSKELKNLLQKNGQLHDKVKDYQNQIQDLQQKNQLLNQQIDAQTKKQEIFVNTQKQQHNELVASLQQEWQSRLEQLQQVYKQAQDQVCELDKSKVENEQQLNEKLEITKKELLSVQQQAQKSQESLLKTKAEQRQSQNQINQLKKELEDVTTKFEGVNKQLGLEQLQNQQLQRECQGGQQRSVQFAQQISEVKEQLATAQRELAKCLAVNDQLIHDANDKNSKIDQTQHLFEQQNQTLMYQVQMLETQNGDLVNQIQEIKSQNEQLNQLNEECKSNLQEQNGTIYRLSATIDKKDKLKEEQDLKNQVQMQELQEQISALEQQVELQEKMKVQTEYDSIQKISELQEQIKILQSDKSQRQKSEIQHLEQKLLKLNERNQSLQQQYDKLVEKNEGLQKSYEAFKQEAKAEKQRDQKLHSDLQQLLLQYQDETRELKRQDQTEKLQEQIQDLMTENELLKQEGGQVITHLKRQISSAVDKGKLLESENAKLQQDLALGQQMLKTQTEINERLHTQMEEKSEQIIELNQKLVATEDQQNKINKQQSLNEKHTKQIQSLTQQVFELGQIKQQLEAQIQELDQQNYESTNTLEKNLALIQQFKTQLQKSIVDNKNYKDQINEITKSKEDFQSQNESLCFFVLESTEQIKGLQQAVFSYQVKQNQCDEEIKQLKSDNAKLEQQLKSVSRTEDLEIQIQDYVAELEAKNDLLEEANNLIEDFNVEKHELKAKFKIIMNHLDEKSEISSYSSGDDIDLNECFERLEYALNQYQGRSQQKIELVNSQNQKLVIEHAQYKVILASRQQQLEQLKNLLQEVQQKLLDQTENVRQQMDKAQRKMQGLKQKLKLVQEQKQEVHDVSLTNNSLQVENIQLLEKLQKAEAALSKVRGSPEKTQNQDIDLQIQNLRKQFITQYQEFQSKMQTQISEEIKSLERAYLTDKIFAWNLSTDRMIHKWNQQAQQVGQFNFNGKMHFLVVDDQDKIYVIAKEELSEDAYFYLKSFTSDPAFFITDQEVPEHLSALISDLRQALLELEQEYNQYKIDQGMSTVDASIVAIRDDNEYLIGENKDLHMKVKEICLLNANLKIMLQKLQASEEKEQRAIIQTANNLSDLDEKEFRERTEFISDHDSFNDIVARDDLKISKEHLEQKVQDITMELEQLREKLQEQEECKNESITLAHIKGTLIQFLKNTPVTDKQNEDLLKITFKMMEFSQNEIQEVANARSGTKLGKSSASNNTSNNNSGEEKRKSNWLGIFGTKQKQNTSLTGGTERKMSPQRPMKQNSQGIN